MTFDIPEPKDIRIERFNINLDVIAKLIPTHIFKGIKLTEFETYDLANFIYDILTKSERSLKTENWPMVATADEDIFYFLKRSDEERGPAIAQVVKESQIKDGTFKGEFLLIDGKRKVLGGEDPTLINKINDFLKNIPPATQNIQADLFDL